MTIYKMIKGQGDIMTKWQRKKWQSDTLTKCNKMTKWQCDIRKTGQKDKTDDYYLYITVPQFKRLFGISGSQAQSQL